MKQVVTLEEAVGLPLAHDITEIRQGEFKGAAFHKGYVLQESDLDHLRRLGKNNLYVIRPSTQEMHEDEAAVTIATALCGSGAGWNEPPREGKITIRAQLDGLLKINVEALLKFNMTGELMCATRHTNSLVKKDDIVAGTRAIPLMVSKTSVEEAVAAARTAAEGVITVLPVRQAVVGVMITGNEVYNGLIEDKFQPIITTKVKALGGSVSKVVFVPDDDQMIIAATRELQGSGINLLITTGGMSVDPDDRTRFALAQAGVSDMTYGSPVLPGAMFMVGRLGNIPVLGIPACGMYSATTILDLVYPRILTGEQLTRTEIAALGHGGLCLQCKHCTFPICPFGK